MNRYYLIVPELTFHKIDPEDENYDQDVYDSLARFSRIHSLDYATITPKKLDGTAVIVETDLDGSQYTEEELQEDYTQEQIDDCKDDEGNLIPVLVEKLKLDNGVVAGNLEDYGTWPHVSGEEHHCIYCYLDEHHDEWYNNEEI